MELPIGVLALALLCILDEDSYVVNADPVKPTLISTYHFDGEDINNNHKQSGYFGSKSGVYESEEYSDNKNDNSLWCAVAEKCSSTSHSICGFDDYFGLAKFNDICHMLQINCYMRYNFSVAAC